jgi:hypothetical protein
MSYNQEPLNGVWDDSLQKLTQYCEGLPVKWHTPEYNIGDLLYAREPWAYVSDWADTDPAVGLSDDYIYKADWVGEECPKWRSAVCMPKEAVRLFVRVASVRAERLQKISPKDCYAGGAVKKPHKMRYGGEDCLVIHKRYIKEFAALWDTLNKGKGYGWDINPWVWRYEFERVTPGIEEYNYPSRIIPKVLDSVIQQVEY